MSIRTRRVLRRPCSRGGRALRRTTLRHTHLGGAARHRRVAARRGALPRAAVAWGPIGGPFELVVAGRASQPRPLLRRSRPVRRGLCACRWRRVSSSRRANSTRSTSRIAAGRRPADRRRQPAPPIGQPSACSGRVPRLPSIAAGRADPARRGRQASPLLQKRRARCRARRLIVPPDRLLADHWATRLSRRSSKPTSPRSTRRSNRRPVITPSTSSAAAEVTRRPIGRNRPRTSTEYPAT